MFVFARHCHRLFIYLISLSCIIDGQNAAQKLQPCNRLLPGQYLCRPPEIDAATQQPVGCTDNVALVSCYPAPSISCCRDTSSSGDCVDVFTQISRSESDVAGDVSLPLNFTDAFERKIPCVSTEGHRFETALLLSVFLGMFGADRFYLGYPALGLIKFCTLGFFFLGQLIDVILIATQVVGPASGKGYVIDFYGPKLSRLEVNELTYFYADYEN